MSSTDGIVPVFSIHALDRYDERFPSGPGIDEEWKTARTASASQLRMIRLLSVGNAKNGRVATKGQIKHWVSRNGCVMVTAPDSGHLVVVTCFQMPKKHPKDGGSHYSRGKIIHRSGTRPRL